MAVSLAPTVSFPRNEIDTLINQNLCLFCKTKLINREGFMVCNTHGCDGSKSNEAKLWILIGESGVGKSSFMKAFTFTDEEFRQDNQRRRELENRGELNHMNNDTNLNDTVQNLLEPRRCIVGGEVFQHFWFCDTQGSNPARVSRRDGQLNESGDIQGYTDEEERKAADELLSYILKITARLNAGVQYGGILLMLKVGDRWDRNLNVIMNVFRRNYPHLPVVVLWSPFSSNTFVYRSRESYIAESMQQLNNEFKIGLDDFVDVTLQAEGEGDELRVRISPEILQAIDRIAVRTRRNATMIRRVTQTLISLTNDFFMYFESRALNMLTEQHNYLSHAFKTILHLPVSAVMIGLGFAAAAVSTPFMLFQISAEMSSEESPKDIFEKHQTQLVKLGLITEDQKKMGA